MRRTVQLQRTRFTPDAYRVMPPDFDAPNDYEVFGGLVLQELSASYVRAWGEEWRNKAPSRLVIEYLQNSLRQPDQGPEHVVIISRVLPDPDNLGYENAANAIVKSVNGRPMTSLAAFREAIRHPVDGYHQLTLLPSTGRGKLIFSAARIADSNARVAQRYGIPPRDDTR